MLLNTQQALRRVRNLPFCYLCGKPIQPGDALNRDHVPPEALFAKADRNFPLILRAHRHCNSAETASDERIGQLIGLKLGRAPSNPKNRRLNIRLAAREQNHARLGILQGFHIEGAIRRWLRAFHAALYAEPLRVDTRFAIQTPFPSGRIDGNRIFFEDLKSQHFRFVETIKRDRVARNVDAIHCNNGKLRYECVWAQADNDGPWLCVFALDVYNWIDLGDVNNFHPRGCAGAYFSPLHGIPVAGAKATRLLFEVPNRHATDPFGM